MTPVDRPRQTHRPLTPDPVLEVYKASLDRTLLRQNLGRTPDERLRNLVELQRLADELRRAGERTRSAR